MKFAQATDDSPSMGASRIHLNDHFLAVADGGFCLHGVPDAVRQYLVAKAQGLEARYTSLLALDTNPVAYNCPDFTADVLCALWPASTALKDEEDGTWTVSVRHGD